MIIAYTMRLFEYYSFFCGIFTGFIVKKAQFQFKNAVSKCPLFQNGVQYYVQFPSCSLIRGISLFYSNFFTIMNFSQNFFLFFCFFILFLFIRSYQ